MFQLTDPTVKKKLRLGAVASVAGKLFHCFIVLGKKLY